MQVAQRAYIVAEGRVIQAGPVEQLVADTRIREAYLGIA